MTDIATIINNGLDLADTFETIVSYGEKLIGKFRGEQKIEKVIKEVIPRYEKIQMGSTFERHTDKEIIEECLKPLLESEEFYDKNLTLDKLYNIVVNYLRGLVKKILSNAYNIIMKKKVDRNEITKINSSGESASTQDDKCIKGLSS